MDGWCPERYRPQKGRQVSSLNPGPGACHTRVFTSVPLGQTNCCPSSSTPRGLEELGQQLVHDRLWARRALTCTITVDCLALQLSLDTVGCAWSRCLQGLTWLLKPAGTRPSANAQTPTSNHYTNIHPLIPENPVCPQPFHPNPNPHKPLSLHSNLRRTHPSIIQYSKTQFSNNWRMKKNLNNGTYMFVSITYISVSIWGRCLSTRKYNILVLSHPAQNNQSDSVFRHWFFERVICFTAEHGSIT